MQPFVLPFEEGLTVYYPDTDRLLILNQTGKLVWEMLDKEFSQEEIVSSFVRYFGISAERAARDVGLLLAQVQDARLASNDDVEMTSGVTAGSARNYSATVSPVEPRACGTFRFGKSLIRVSSSVQEVDDSLFLRFQHRAVGDPSGAELLELSGSEPVYRLVFGGHVVDEVATTNRLLSTVVGHLLKLEHPGRDLLAYCHAAAVYREGRSLLMPGSSGVGKSTLTAFLVANGFTYLADDAVAIGENDFSLLPLPTCLSIKSGSWATLQPFYPGLPQLPTVERYARILRYVAPEANYETISAAAAPVAIVFPVYQIGESTRRTRLPAIQTMIRLVGAHARLSLPATEAKLGRLIRFVEQTPAYELTYSELPSALKAIEDLLAAQPQQ